MKRALCVAAGVGTLASMALAFVAHSCPFCELLRALSLGVFVLSLQSALHPGDRPPASLAVLMTLGLLLAGYLHLTSAGWVGCPADCAATRVGGIDTRSLALVYFGGLALLALGAYGRPLRDLTAVSLAVVCLFMAPVALRPPRVSSGMAEGVEGSFLFVRLDCPHCRELLRKGGDELLRESIDIRVLGDAELCEQLYSCTSAPSALLVSFCRSGADDLFEYSKQMRQPECDVRRGRLEAKKTDELARALRIAETPHLIVARKGRFVGVDAKGLEAESIAMTLSEARGRLARE